MESGSKKEAGERNTFPFLLGLIVITNDHSSHVKSVNTGRVCRRLRFMGVSGEHRGFIQRK